MKKFGLVLVVATLCFSALGDASAQQRRVELRFQGGLNVGVPIFLDVDRSIVKPGASFTGWGGFDIGWVAFDFGLGLMWNTINTNNVTEVVSESLGRQPLISWHFSPGVRFQVPTIDDVLPYVAARFNASLWQLEALGVNCGWYYCQDETQFRFAPGFTTKAGVAVRLKGPWFLDVGMKVSMSGKGQFFDKTQWWVEPFVGFLFRGDRDGFDGIGF